MNPLSGLTALDFGQVYNGPYCGFLMAQAGANVIKVESLKGEPCVQPTQKLQQPILLPY